MLFGPATHGRRVRIMQALRRTLYEKANKLPIYTARDLKRISGVAGAAVTKRFWDNAAAMDKGIAEYKKNNRLRRASDQRASTLARLSRKRPATEQLPETRKRFRGNPNQAGLPTFNFPESATGGGDDMSGDMMHGDSADAVDGAFDRDSENPSAQKALASSLWPRAPRIYDDEIIVRLPRVTTSAKTTSNADTSPTVFVQVRLNDAYKPDNASAIQCKGMAHYTNIYKYYQVLETRVTFDIEMLAPTVTATGTQTYITTDLPILFGTFMSANGQNNTPATFDLWKSVALSNPCPKTNIFSNVVELAQHGGMQHQQTRHQFHIKWTPAQFDDLEIDITRQALTSTTASPNWVNWGELMWANPNSSNTTTLPGFQVITRVEQLVHFKRINTATYYAS